MTIKKKHGPRGTGDELAGSFLPTAMAVPVLLQSPCLPPGRRLPAPHHTAFLRGRLNLRHTRWVCQACLQQLNFQFTRKIKSESSKEFTELCIIYLLTAEPQRDPACRALF